MKARLNPFNSRQIEGLPYRFLDGSEERVLARLRQLRFRAAVLGPEGSGKTTLLELIASKLPGIGLQPVWIRVSRDHPVLPALPPFTGAQVVLVDGADSLPAFRWLLLRRAARSAGGLVITSHRAEMLPVLFRCRTTPELLRELVEVLAPPAESIEELFARHRGNLRNALRELYDICAGISYL